MRADVNLDPDELRAVAAAVAELADDLRPLLAARPEVPADFPDRPDVLAEQARLGTTVERVAAELRALHDALRDAAVAAEHTDRDLARRLRRCAG